MNVKSLIQKAYTYANIIAEEGEETDAKELQRGLDLLNILIEEINIDSEESSLLSQEDFSLVAGSQTLDLPDWTKILKIQYLIGSTIYDIVLLSLNEFLNKRRVTTTNGIPLIGYPKRTDSGIELNMYFIPSTDYSLTVYGYKNLSTVSLTDTLTGKLAFIQNYLLFKLAQDLRIYHQKEISPFLQARIIRLRERLFKIKETVIEMNTYSMGTAVSSESYTAINNLGRGWMPT